MKKKNRCGVPLRVASEPRTKAHNPGPNFRRCQYPLLSFRQHMTTPFEHATFSSVRLLSMPNIPHLFPDHPHPMCREHGTWKVRAVEKQMGFWWGDFVVFAVAGHLRGSLRSITMAEGFQRGLSVGAESPAGAPGGCLPPAACAAGFHNARGLPVTACPTKTPKYSA